MPSDTDPFLAPNARRTPGSEEVELASKAGLVWDDERQAFFEAPPNRHCGRVGCPVQVTHSHTSDVAAPPPTNDNHHIAETDPTGRLAGDPGAKLDMGKSPIYRGVLSYFPRALGAVARVSEFGANKYSWGGWQSVPDGVLRYSDALGRHLLEESVEAYDAETGFHHAIQVAWNALARLELMIREAEGRE